MRSTAARPRVVPALVAVLLACTATGVAVGAPSTGTAAQVEGHPTTMEVTIRENGDARWVITMRFDTSTSDLRAGFERIANEFENGSSAYLSIGPFERAAALASQATGREMAIAAVDRATELRGDVGVLVLSFTWRGFARTPGDRIAVGDVFRTPNGTWLDRLTAGQELLLRFPSGYGPETVDWPIRNGSVYIAGPVEFAPGEPSAVFAPARVTTPSETPTPTPSETSTPTSTPSETSTPTNGVGPGDRSGGIPVAGILAGLIVVGLLAYVIWERGDRLPFGGVTPGDGPGDGDATTDSGSAPPTGAPADEEPSADEEPLLSDEERVLRLLRANGGRMKQAKIVEETDWSNAKVSQLLSEMDENGDVEKLRLGRENLISLPGEAPDGVE